MIHPQALIKLFNYNFELVSKQASGVSHLESLLQPPCGGNCFNWLLGHVISSRTFPLRYVGEQPVWTDLQRARYRADTVAITGDEEGVINFDDLVIALNLSQERLLDALNRMNYEDMCRPSGFADNTVGDSLGYFYFHEAQHVGQILHLTHFLGKQGHWIS
jgi:hypothetical protein